MEYGLQVTGGGGDWTVWKRYSEFAAFRAELRSPPVPFPPKQWFVRHSTSDRIAAERKAGLQRWIDTAVLADPTVAVSAEWFSFSGARARAEAARSTGAARERRRSEAAALYLEEHGAQRAVLVAVRRAVAERPPDAVAAIARYLMEAAETDEAATVATSLGLTHAVALPVHVGETLTGVIVLWN